VEIGWISQWDSRVGGRIWMGSTSIYVSKVRTVNEERHARVEAAELSFAET
jgi:hypothetical protein